MAINLLYWLCTSQIAIKYKQWGEGSAGVRKKGCRWHCSDNLCYRWKHFPDWRLLSITEWCPRARGFCPAAEHQQGRDRGSPDVTKPRPCLGCRAARLGTPLGTCPRPWESHPIAVGAAKGPQLGTAGCRDLGQRRRSCRTKGSALSKGVPAKSDGEFQTGLQQH